MNRNLHAFLHLMKVFFEFVCFPQLKKTQMSFEKLQIWPKIKFFSKIIKNQQILVFVTIPSTNL